MGEVHPEKIAPWSDIDGPVYRDAPTSGGGPAREIAADLFRLNDLLDVLKVNSILSRTLRLWVCIRRYDGLCVVAGNFGREAKKKQDAHRTSC